MLVGSEISFRPPTAEDAPRIAEWFSDPEYLGPHYNVQPRTRQWAEQIVAAYQPGPEQGFFLLVRRRDGEPLGTAGYFNPYVPASLLSGRELFYHVHPRWRRRGVATAAACLLVNHLFDSTPLERLQATVVADNAPSHRVLERAGLRRDGVLRRAAFVHGRYVDLDLYAIVRDEWRDEESYRAGRQPF